MMVLFGTVGQARSALARINAELNHPDEIPVTDPRVGGSRRGPRRPVRTESFTQLEQYTGGDGRYGFVLTQEVYDRMATVPGQPLPALEARPGVPDDWEDVANRAPPPPPPDDEPDDPQCPPPPPPPCDP
jgi:hypothetical protein